MNSIVLTATRHGNTSALGDVVAHVLEAHGQVTRWAVEDAPPDVPPGTDLLVVGGPTEAHGMTTPLTQWFDKLAPMALAGMAAAAFDTRLSWPAIISGSAAKGIARRLAGAGARPMAPAGSFIVTRTPELVSGEAERAAAWAEEIAARLSATPVA